MEAGEIRIPGMHNVEIIMAGSCASQPLCTAETVRQVAMEFAGVNIASSWPPAGRVDYYNDPSPQPGPSHRRFRAFDQKLIVIAGGYDKKFPFEDTAESLPALQGRRC